jgi:phosphatidylserine synthase
VATWILAVTFRLARYNIVGDDPKCRRIFFGVPTTLMGGILCGLFLTALKYGADFAPLPGAWRFAELKLPISIGPGIWKVWPFLVFAGAFLMASTFKIPKLGVSRWKPLTYFIFLNVFTGYVFGALRHFPEFLLLIASLYTTVSIVWGVFSKEVKGLRAPPIFPKVDPAPGKEPQRPEEDAVPDEA